MGSDPVNYYQLVIGIGAWLGTIMLFNVWVLIWPNQKKVLGIVPATDDEKATARKTGDARFAHELRALDPDAALHGLGHARPAVLSGAAGSDAATQESPASAGLSFCGRIQSQRLQSTV